jgi:hypothetical protein
MSQTLNVIQKILDECPILDEWQLDRGKDQPRVPLGTSLCEEVRKVLVNAEELLQPYNNLAFGWERIRLVFIPSFLFAANNRRIYDSIEHVEKTCNQLQLVLTAGLLHVNTEWYGEDEEAFYLMQSIVRGGTVRQVAKADKLGHFLVLA